jgi:hypothetical protein
MDTQPTKTPPTSSTASDSTKKVRREGDLTITTQSMADNENLPDDNYTSPLTTTTNPHGE